MGALPVGDIGIYPANSRPRFQSYQNAECIQLYLEPSFLTQVGAELFPNNDIALIPLLTLGFDPLIYQIAIALKTALKIDTTRSKSQGRFLHFRNAAMPPLPIFSLISASIFP